LLLMNTCTTIVAQDTIQPTDTRPLNTLNISILGDASAVAINYEKLFLVNKAFIISSKLGIGYNEELRFCFFGQCTTPVKQFFTLCHHITGDYGKGRYFYEFALGGTIVIGNTTRPYLFYPTLGYRYLPVSPRKSNFRVYGQIPVTGFETDDLFSFP